MNWYVKHVLRRRSVEAFQGGEARQEWQYWLIGFITRLRGIIVSFLFTVLTLSSVPFWWPASFDAKYSFVLREAIIGVALIFGTTVAIGFYYLRKRSIRSLNIKWFLHQFAHCLREKQTKEYEYLYNYLDKIDICIEEDLFNDFVKELCEHTKDYFRLIINNDSIESAVRLAANRGQEEENPDIVFRTVARSSGLEPKRRETTQDISIYEGIPKYFKDRGCRGVLVYNDIEAAAVEGAFTLTASEAAFPTDIKTFMVAPLNAWDGERQGMIGLLYVTSRSENIFKVKHIDSLRFVADLIAFKLAFIAENRRLRQYVRKQREEREGENEPS